MLEVSASIKYDDSGSIDIEKTLSLVRDKLVKLELKNNSSRIKILDALNKVFDYSGNRYISIASVAKIALANHWLEANVDDFSYYEEMTLNMLRANLTKKPNLCSSNEKEYLLKQGRNGGIVRWSNLSNEEQQAALKSEK